MTSLTCNRLTCRDLLGFRKSSSLQCDRGGIRGSLDHGDLHEGHQQSEPHHGDHLRRCLGCWGLLSGLGQYDKRKSLLNTRGLFCQQKGPQSDTHVSNDHVQRTLLMRLFTKPYVLKCIRPWMLVNLLRHVQRKSAPLPLSPYGKQGQSSSLGISLVRINMLVITSW